MAALKYQSCEVPLGIVSSVLISWKHLCERQKGQTARRKMYHKPAFWMSADYSLFISSEDLALELGLPVTVTCGSVNECSLYKCQKGTLTFQLGWIRNITSTLFSCEQWLSSSHRSFNSGKSQGRVSSSLKSRHHFSKTASSCPGQSCPHKVYSGKPFRIFDQNKERHDVIKL